MKTTKANIELISPSGGDGYESFLDRLRETGDQETPKEELLCHMPVFLEISDGRRIQLINERKSMQKLMAPLRLDDSNSPCLLTGTMKDFIQVFDDYAASETAAGRTNTHMTLARLLNLEFPEIIPEDKYGLPFKDDTELIRKVPTPSADSGISPEFLTILRHNKVLTRENFLLKYARHQPVTVKRHMTHTVLLTGTKDMIACLPKESEITVVSSPYDKKYITCVEPKAAINPEFKRVWEKTCKAQETAYQKLLRTGIAPHDAALVLPSCVKYQVLATATEEAWEHAFQNLPENKPDFVSVMRLLHEKMKLATNGRIQ